MKRLALFVAISMAASLVTSQCVYPDDQYRELNHSNSFSDSLDHQQDQSYNYQQLRKAESQTVIGVLLIIAGTGMTVGGISKMSSNYSKWVESNYQDSGDGAGALLTLFGCGALGTGIPLVIVGSHNKRKYNRLVQGTQKQVSLQLQFNENGAGLALRF